MARDIKILVAVIVSALVIFSIIAIIFIPLPAISTYNNTLSLIDFKERMGVVYELSKLKKDDTYGDGVGFNSFDHQTIILSRKKLFAPNGENTNTIDGLTFYSYTEIDNMLDLALDYYVGFSKSLQGATRSSQRSVEKLISNYRSVATSVDLNIENVRLFQKEELTTEDDIKFLTNRYIELQNSYRETLKIQADLILKINSMLHNYCKEFYDTPYTILISSFAYSVFYAMNESYQAENEFLYNSSIIMDKIKTFNNKGNVFTKISELEIISAYKNVYYNYNESLDQIFRLTNDIKKKVIEEDDFANSDIKIEFQKDVRTILRFVEEV